MLDVVQCWTEKIDKLASTLSNKFYEKLSSELYSGGLKMYKNTLC